MLDQRGKGAAVAGGPAVTLNIDGRDVTVAQGTTVWDAARESGIPIPVLCHDPKLRPVGVCRADIDAVLPNFTGSIDQVPPMYSALKHEGRRLYQLAREGQQVERKPRRVEIHGLRLLGHEAQAVTIEVCCSKGTYIRTLAEDIGNALGCGAHLTALRRTAVGELSLTDAISLERLERQLSQQGLESLDQLLLPTSVALAQFSELTLDVDSSRAICHGRRVKLESPPAAGLYRLVSGEGRFLGLGEVGPGAELAAKRLMNTAR